MTEQILERCLQLITIQPFMMVLKDQKPAVAGVLKPILDKYKTNATPSASHLLSNNPNSKSVVKMEANSESSMALESSDSQPISSFNDMKVEQQCLNVPRSHNPMGDNPRRTLESDTQKISIEKQSMFMYTGQKETRALFEEVNKWPIDEIKDELVDLLFENLRCNVHQELFSRMLSQDSRKNLEAIAMLKKGVMFELAGIIDVFDLICKWIFIKLWESSNSTFLKEVLDLLSLAFNAFENSVSFISPQFHR
jgi:hypothetical protein